MFFLSKVCLYTGYSKTFKNAIYRISKSFQVSCHFFRGPCSARQQIQRRLYHKYCSLYYCRMQTRSDFDQTWEVQALLLHDCSEQQRPPASRTASAHGSGTRSMLLKYFSVATQGTIFPWLQTLRRGCDLRYFETYQSNLFQLPE